MEPSIDIELASDGEITWAILHWLKCTAADERESARARAPRLYFDKPGDDRGQ